MLYSDLLQHILIRAIGNHWNYLKSILQRMKCRDYYRQCLHIQEEVFDILLLIKVQNLLNIEYMNLLYLHSHNFKVTVSSHQPNQYSIQHRMRCSFDCYPYLHN